MADDRRLNIRIDPEIHRRLRLDAAQQDKSIQQVVEELLRAKYGPPPADEGRKGAGLYAINPHSASTCADH
jgi:plasmid stability protein